MSDLRPRGRDVRLPEVGVRNFLFTLNVIDAVQDKYKDQTVLDVFKTMLEGTPKEQNSVLRNLVYILLEDERERKLWRNPQAEIEEITRKQVGWLLDIDNIEETKAEILRAYRIAVPEFNSDEEEDPNA